MSKVRIAIVNGPNLDRIGKREPSIYGATPLDAYYEQLREKYSSSVDFSYFQSNHEGALIDELYRLSDSGVEGIVLNAGAYTHTSIALLDAIRAIACPVIEVHLSNIYAREPYRQHSMLASACLGTIGGFGLTSYRLAVEALLTKNQEQI